MSRRTERLGSLIRQELAMMILRDLNDPRLKGMPSITRVEVSADLSVADVFVTVMGTPGEQSAALNALRHSAGRMRTMLTPSLSLRQTPFLKFHLDERLRKEIELLNLIEATKREDQQRSAEKSGKAPASTESGDANETPADAPAGDQDPQP